MKRNWIFIFSIFTFTTLLAQDDDTQNTNEVEYTYEEPFQVPGEVVVDFGFNFVRNSNSDFDIGFWGSKSVSIYYLYEWPNKETHFTINPGIGVGLEKYDFEDSYTLEKVRDPEGSFTRRLNLDSTFQATNFEFDEIRKTKLAANYIEIPLEFRYYQNKRNHRRGFRAAVGVKGGVLFSSHTKIKYEEDGDVIKIKDKQQFDLNRLRWSLSGRVGYGRFSLFYEQGMSQIFDGENGPSGTEATYWKVGVSVIGF